MRLVQYTGLDGMRVGVQHDDAVFDTGYPDMLTFIQDGDDALDRARRAAKASTPADVARLLATLTNPPTIFGSGPNYLSHGEEEPGWVPSDEPRWDFIILSTAITGPYDDIVIPSGDDVIRRVPGGKHPHSQFGFAVDYEVELGVVLGKTGKNVSESDARNMIFGYTIINDVGAPEASSSTSTSATSRRTSTPSAPWARAS